MEDESEADGGGVETTSEAKCADASAAAAIASASAVDETLGDRITVTTGGPDREGCADDKNNKNQK